MEKPEEKESAPATIKAAPKPARRSRQPAAGKQHTVGENVGDFKSVTQKEGLLPGQMRQVLNDMSPAEVKAWISAGDGISKEMEKKNMFPTDTAVEHSRGSWRPDDRGIGPAGGVRLTA